MSALKIFMQPEFNPIDHGEGGIKRVVEAQRKWLPIVSDGSITFTPNPGESDLVCVHAGHWVDVPGVPVVTHCHGLYWEGYQWGPAEYATNSDVISALRRATAICAPTEWLAQVLRRGMWVKPTVIPHGIDPDEWIPVEEDAGYVLWNKTRVDPICDVDPLNRLVASAPGTQFVSTFGVEAPNLHTVGRLPYAAGAELVRNAGVYLCTSRETFGIGTLEAMACGVPVLGWAWGGQREFVHHKVDGYLCSPGDFEGLREGLEWCIANRSVAGPAARATALGYTWSHACEQYADLYTKVVAAHSEARPTISVVIPCYNLGRYLPACIDSVMNQTMMAGANTGEIIIVDDCSTDNSLEIAKGLEQRYPNTITVIQTPSNLYLSGALNYGIEASTGRYVMPLDADNMLGPDPNVLATLSNALGRGDLDIAFGRIQFVLEDGKTPDQTVAVDGVSSWPPVGFDFWAQITHHNQVPSSVLMRREVWARTGGYRRRCPTAEDADFWCRATRLGFVPRHVTNMVTLRYRQRADSMSRQQRDWPWHLWYPESLDSQVAPMAAPVQARVGSRAIVQSYEPIKIDVVIPVGPEHEGLVVDAVDSLVAQTFDRGLWNVIVVNDTGKPLPWIHPFAHTVRLKGKRDVSVHRPAYARNAGVALGTAPLVLFLDADDYLRPDALQRMYDAYMTPNSSGVVGGYVYCDWTVAETNEVRNTPDWKCELVQDQLVHPITMLVSRAAFGAVGGFDTKLVGYEDWDFVFGLNAAGYCGTRVPEALLYYRLEAGGRRKMLADRRDEFRAEIQGKWSDYIKGVKQMPCGCAGGGGNILTAQAVMRMNANAGAGPAPATPQAEVLPEAILLGYDGPNVTVTYRGVSGASYKFGQASGHKVRWVKTIDAEAFLNRPEFKRVSPDALMEGGPHLVASGPPAAH